MLSRLITILRRSLNTLVTVILGVCAVGYVALRSDRVEQAVARQVEQGLAAMLQTEVRVGHVEMRGVNMAAVGPVTVYDQTGDTLLFARRMMVSYELVPLLWRNLRLSTVGLIDFDVRIRQERAGAPLNFQFVIDALSPREPSSDALFEAFSIGGIMLRRGRVSFDRTTAPPRAGHQLDPGHIRVDGVSAWLSVDYTPAEGTHIGVRRMEMRERCGLALSRTAGRLHIGKGCLAVDGLDLHVGRSRLSLNHAAVADHPRHALDRADSSVWLLDADSLTCTLSTSDLLTVIGPVVPAGLTLRLQGGMHATSRRLDVGPLSLWGDDSLHVAATLRADRALPAPGHPEGEWRWRADLTEGYLPARLVQAALPQLAARLGDATAEALCTLVGDVRLTARAEGPLNELALSGSVATDGHWDGQPVASSLRIEGQLTDGRLTEGRVDGSLPRAGYRGHLYHDVRLHGQMGGGLAHLSASVSDPDVTADVQATLHHATPRPRFVVAARLDHFAPARLHLVDLAQADSIALSLMLTADVSGRSISDLTGAVRIDSLMLSRGEGREELSLDPIRLYLGRTSTVRSGVLRSPMLRVDYEQGPDRLHRFACVALPCPELYHLLRIPFEMSGPAEMQATCDDQMRPRSLTAHLPETRLPGGVLSGSIDSHAQSHDVDSLERLLTHLSADLIGGRRGQYPMSLTLSGMIDVRRLTLDLLPGCIAVGSNEFYTKGGHISLGGPEGVAADGVILQHDSQQIAIGGRLSGRMRLGEGPQGLAIRLSQVELRPLMGILGYTYLDLGGTVTGTVRYAVREGRPKLWSDHLSIDDFSYIGTVVGHGDFAAAFDLNRKRLEVEARLRSAEGTHSHIDADIQLGRRDSMDLRLDLDRLPIDFCGYWLADVFSDFRGYGSGRIHVWGECKRPHLQGHPLADITCTHPFIGTRLHLNDLVELTADPTDGADGHIRLRQVAVDDGHGHTMRVTADVRHDHLHDYHYAVDVNIPHSTTQGFLVYDHPQQVDGALYWGQIYASGQAHLEGGDGRHEIRVNMQTADHSTFYLSPGEEHPDEDDGTYQLITYRPASAGQTPPPDVSMDAAPRPTTQTTAAPAPAATGSDGTPPDATSGLPPAAEGRAPGQAGTHGAAPTQAPKGMHIDLNLTATERCQMVVQMDPLADDRLVCRGHGDLLVHYDPRQDLSVTGRYHMSTGTYTITMGSGLVTKEFQLLPTSSVRFAGPPSAAELDWDCRYAIPSVNLTDLDQSFASLASTSRTSLPVDCKMKVTGPIASPTVRFDLEVKNVSDDVQALVHNLIGTDEMLNQEVFYLLLFSRFYTPSYATAQETHTGSELTSLASASINSQLNSLLSRLSSDFTLGTNFHSERGDFTDMEMDVAITTRLFTGRLLLGAGFGYRDPSTRIGLATGSTSAFVGDFDAEYLINPTGTLRAKAYSHYNERDYSINNALTTQGLGIVMRRDFSYWRDLLRLKARTRTATTGQTERDAPTQ